MNTTKGGTLAKSIATTSMNPGIRTQITNGLFMETHLVQDDSTWRT